MSSDKMQIRIHGNNFGAHKGSILPYLFKLVIEISK